MRSEVRFPELLSISGLFNGPYISLSTRVASRKQNQERLVLVTRTTVVCTA